MSAWSDFQPLVMMRLPECPTFVVDDVARLQAIRFFLDTRTWRDAAPETKIAATTAGTALYTITPPPQGELCGICEAWYDGRRIDEARNQQYRDRREWPSDAPPENGTPSRVATASGTQVRLLPTPDVDDKVLVASFAYCPTTDAASLLTTLFSAYSDAIAEAIVAECAGHKGKPWSDATIASRAAGEYNRLALQLSLIHI